MPGVFFTNLALLGGLMALAIPILIHLLLKQKMQRLRFSTIQFFARHDEQASRRRKLRHWLLLATRLLLVALLVLAFARPYAKTNPAFGDFRKPRLAVFVLDRSASMQATVQGQSHWQRALDLMRQALSGFKGEDRVAVVSCSARAEVLSSFKPAAVAARLLKELAPEFGPSNLADGLRRAVKLLPATDTSTAPMIYVVSDLQQTACAQIESVPLRQDIELHLLKAGDLSAPNVAVADLRMEGGVRPALQVTVKSFSDEEAGRRKLALAIDGRELSTTVLSLPSGAQSNVVLSIPGLKPGWHHAEARLETGDALAADDHRYQVFFIAEPMRVLCVETRKAARIIDQDSFFVASALQPGADLTNEIPALFTVTLALPGELGKALRGPNATSPYSVAVLPGLREIPSEAGEALTTFVRRGGGVALFLGDAVSANRYNAEFRDLLPARLDRAETRGNGGWHLDEFEKRSALFEVFEGAWTASLRLPEFTHRFALTPLQETSVLAKLDDGTPLVITRKLGEGRILLINTSSDTSWSDWPKHKSFVPWMHGVVNYLGDRSSRETLQPRVTFDAGQEEDVTVGKQWQAQALTLIHAGSKDQTLTTDAEGRLALPNFSTPGIYSLRDRTGTEVRRWAVNVPDQESDLAALAAPDFQKRLVRSREPAPASLEANLFASSDGQKEWWRVLFLCALLLLFLEVFLANRTRA